MFDFGAVQWDSGLWTDGLWAVCLGLMAFVSLQAWRRIQPQAWTPLQWGRDGKPVMRAQRNLAVAFTPLAAAVAGLMMAAGERMAGEPSDGWMALRMVAPVLLVVAHRAHLSSALKTLAVEGGLKA